MMTSARASLPLLLLMILAVAGCKMVDTIKEKQLGVELEDHLKGYQAALRWGRIEDAYGFLKPEIARQVVLPKGLENIRVTQYRVIKPPTFGSKTTATQTVAISYILIDRQVEHTLIDNQIWQRESEQAVEWYRVNPIPEFK